MLGEIGAHHDWLQRELHTISHDYATRPILSLILDSVDHLLEIYQRVGP